MRFEAADTITIVPEHEIDLGGSFVAQTGLLSARTADRLFVPRKEGTVLVLDSTLSTLLQFPLENNLRLQKISSSGHWLVLNNSEGFQIRTIEGAKVYEERAADFRFDDFLFSAEDDKLWIIGKVNSDQVRLECRNTRDWQMERFVTFEEPTSHTNFFLSLHPEKQVIAIWAAAGQDGQWIYWAIDDQSQIRVHQTEIRDTTWPVFHPLGGEFVVDDGGYLKLHDFPEGDELDWYGPDVDSDESHNVSTAHYVSDTQLLFVTNAGRLFLTTLDPFEATHEIVIEGHEPGPDPEDDPWLDEEEYEEGLFADFDWIHPFGDKFVSIHRQGHWRAKKKTYRLSIWKKPPQCGKTSEPDPSAPFTKQLLELLE